MYENHFGIRKKPFSIAPDPKFLYMSDGHREALAHLRYGLESEGGFVLLTGEVGAGKTTVCRCLLEQVPADSDIAYILNSKVTVLELLETICDELEISYPSGAASAKTLVDAINKHLLGAHAAGRRTVLIIDEAQNLEADVLEQVRLLTNLETHQQKLLQIILLGQPELQEKLNRKELYQLSQRISARHHLGPLDRKETKAYVLHRLSVAGLNTQVFSDESYAKLYQLTDGIPRLINMIGDRALLGAFSKEKSHVDKKMVEQAAREVFGEKVKKSAAFLSIPAWKIAAVTSSIVLVLLGVIFSLSGPLTETEEEHQAFEAVKQIMQLENEAVAQIVRPQMNKSESSFETNDSEKIDSGQENADDLRTAGNYSPAVKWPAGEEAYLSEDLAFRNVFALWGIEGHPEGQSPCRFAERNGLYCMEQQDSIESLLRLNRPAVLLMLNQKGEEFYAALLKVSGGEAFLQPGDKTYQVRLDDIAPYWTGRYTLLWQPPPGYQGSIRPGREGRDVAWLARQLSIISGENPANTGDTEIFNNDLVRKIKVFQFANGLISDGIAGKETLIMVNSKAGNKVPVLVQ